MPLPPRSILFPYTTLFRSHVLELTGDFAGAATSTAVGALVDVQRAGGIVAWLQPLHGALFPPDLAANGVEDRKSTRLNSSHGYISYAVFCSKKKIPSTPYQ